MNTQLYILDDNGKETEIQATDIVIKSTSMVDQGHQHIVYDDILKDSIDNDAYSFGLKVTMNDKNRRKLFNYLKSPIQAIKTVAQPYYRQGMRW